MAFFILVFLFFRDFDFVALLLLDLIADLFGHGLAGILDFIAHFSRNVFADIPLNGLAVLIGDLLANWLGHILAFFLGHLKAVFKPQIT